jgi:hypothetical protein
MVAADLVIDTSVPGGPGGAGFDPNAAQTLTNKTIDSASNSILIHLNSSAVTGKLPVTNVNVAGTPNGTQFLRDDGSWASPGTGSPFSNTLLNAVVAAGAGPSFSYPGGSSTLTVTGSNFNGAVVTFQFSTDSGTTWSPVGGDYSSFSAAGQAFINGLTAGVLVRALVTGTPAAGITAVLSR